MKEFENVYILKGSLTEEQAKKEIENIKKYFENVKVFEKENSINGYQSLKHLAYETRGEKTGYYFVTHFFGTDDRVTGVERQLRLNDSVIKFITIRI